MNYTSTDLCACGRPLQPGYPLEITGVCDACEHNKRSFRARMARLLAEDPEGCECAVCVKNWEELG